MLFRQLYQPLVNLVLDLEYIDGSLLKNYTENWKTFLPDLLNIEGNADESAKIIHDRFFSSENPFRAVEHVSVAN